MVLGTYLNKASFLDNDLFTAQVAVNRVLAIYVQSLVSLLLVFPKLDRPDWLTFNFYHHGYDHGRE